jgi:hypothetical protein
MAQELENWGSAADKCLNFISPFSEHLEKWHGSDRQSTEARAILRRRLREASQWMRSLAAVLGVDRGD